jgi:glyoxylase-like metal-dependent hydrolase (beta-lactamase superfamily II)
MQQLAENVYIEDQFPGVTLGAINLPHGLIQIDAPPSMDDNRTWRATLLNLGGGVERILVNLDAHPDRTLGARAMDCTVIAHEKTAQAFRNRPNTFKPQVEETGADWEQFSGMGNVRWVPPEITFTDRMVIEWSNTSIALEHHPGPSAGSIWVILPRQKVIFVGDTVMKQQPPFLAWANIPLWLESIEQLQSREYQKYTVVSGRGGTVSTAAIQSQRDLLAKIQAELDKFASKHPALQMVEPLVQPLLSSIRAPASRHKQYAQRLRYGLQRYYSRHYHRLEGAAESEE